MKKIKKSVSRSIRKLRSILHYSNRLSSNNRIDKKRIIICFDGLFPHGGLVDRLKGIVSFYEISKLLDYKFYIHFDHPFDLDTFLNQHQVEWKIDGQEVCWSPFNSKVLYLVNDFKADPLKIIKSSKATNFIVYANIDYLNKIHPSLGKNELECLWRNCFNELFKTSDLLNENLKAIENDMYISFHTRFTSLMGDFKDTSKKKVSIEEKEILLIKLKRIVEELVNNSKYKCYAFSDSINFLNYIKRNVDVSIVKGIPYHMDDFGKESTLDQHLKTLIDFFVIANSEAVYFLKIDPMYNSSFSKYAAIIGNKQFNTILN